MPTPGKASRSNALFQCRSFTTARVPCTAIERYPVVARWRNDVEFTAAGIYCFQPFCVTGEMDPPANPLIQPQFCVRFNDLDNIGITGRHYSGFVMLGIQTFNYPDKYVFFKEECIEFNYRYPERSSLGGLLKSSKSILTNSPSSKMSGQAVETSVPASNTLRTA